MEIKISKKDYDVLVRNIAIWNWVYWIMSDMVDSKFKKEADEWDILLDKILKSSENKDIYEKFDWKLMLTDEYMEKITDDMVTYDTSVFWEKLIDELAKKRMWAKINLLENYMMDDEYYEHLDFVWKEFQKNWLKNVYLKED